jgi:hypothetical protein
MPSIGSASCSTTSGSWARTPTATSGRGPVTAVERLLETRQFDEIILSTLPQHVSKWLRVDLPTGCTATPGCR